MILLVAFAIISIGFSFLCSILEAALLSITPSYIASLKNDRPQLFARLRRLKDEIDDPLSAILTFFRQLDRHFGNLLGFVTDPFQVSHHLDH